MGFTESSGRIEQIFNIAPTVISQYYYSSNCLHFTGPDKDAAISWSTIEELLD